MGRVEVFPFVSRFVAFGNVFRSYTVVFRVVGANGVEGRGKVRSIVVAASYDFGSFRRVDG